MAVLAAAAFLPFLGRPIVFHLLDHLLAQGVTGFVLSDGVFLTALELRQMRIQPEVVVLNGCHLGQVEASNTPARALYDRFGLKTELYRYHYRRQPEAAG